MRSVAGRCSAVTLLLCLALARAESVDARSLVNDVNPQCVDRVLRSPRFNTFEPSARVSAYLDCTTRGLEARWTEGRQLRGVLDQMDTERDRRLRQAHRASCEERVELDRFRTAQLAELARIVPQLQDALALLGMIRSDREQDIMRESRDGVLRHANRDWLAFVQARNRVETAPDGQLHDSLARARSTAQGLARPFLPLCESPPERCAWISERQLGVFGSNRYVCMCGGHYETQHPERCGRPPGPTR